MTALTTGMVREEMRQREARLTTGEVVVLTLTVRASTPGECCVTIASALRFDYAPPLADDVAVRFDDRLYDGLYAGLAALAGPLPPEHLKVEVVALSADPPLAALVASENWGLIGEIGAALEGLAAAAITVAAASLLADLVAVPVGALA